MEELAYSSVRSGMGGGRLPSPSHPTNTWSCGRAGPTLMSCALRRATSNKSPTAQRCGCERTREPTLRLWKWEKWPSLASGFRRWTSLGSAGEVTLVLRTRQSWWTDQPCNFLGPGLGLRVDLPNIHPICRLLEHGVGGWVGYSYGPRTARSPWHRAAMECPGRVAETRDLKPDQLFFGWVHVKNLDGWRG